MRKLPCASFRLRHRRSPQCFDAPALNLLRGKRRLMRANCLLDLRPHSHHWIQRRHGLLKNHRDLAPAHAAPSALIQAQQLPRLAVRTERRAPLHPRAFRQKPHQRQRQHRLPAARFAHQPQRIARANPQRDFVYRANPSRRCRQFHDEFLHLKQCAHASIIVRPRISRAGMHRRLPAAITNFRAAAFRDAATLDCLLGNASCS